jgi:hypothetical protein
LNELHLIRSEWPIQQRFLGHGRDFHAEVAGGAEGKKAEGGESRDVIPAEAGTQDLMMAVKRHIKHEKE